MPIDFQAAIDQAKEDDDTQTRAQEQGLAGKAAPLPAEPLAAGQPPVAKKQRKENRNRRVARASARKAAEDKLLRTVEEAQKGTLQISQRNCIAKN